MLTGTTLSLAVGCSEPSSRRAQALVDGTVTVRGCDVRFITLGPGEMLLRAFTDPGMNVAELSLSSLVSRLAERDCPYVMLPLYMARSFPHSWFHVRTDRGIASLSDLRGKRIGTSAYPRTLNVWARGFLRDEGAISPGDVRWVIKDNADAIEAFSPSGASIEVSRSGKSLSELLETGEIDAMISLHPPECVERGAPRVKRLVEDDDQADRDYYDRTGVFPILHVMGVRKSLVNESPRLASDLVAAFSKAKALASGTTERGVPAWRSQAFRYGVDQANRSALEHFLRYHFTQGLSQRAVQLDELFAPISATQYEDKA